MATFVSASDVTDQYPDMGELTAGQIDGVIRRAERSLAGMVGDLSLYDQQLVVDTVVDAVKRRLDNPSGFIEETSGDYTYKLAKGADGFWWPEDWRTLFGIPTLAGAQSVWLSGLCGSWGPQR